MKKFLLVCLLIPYAILVFSQGNCNAPFNPCDTIHFDCYSQEESNPPTSAPECHTYEI